MRGWLTVGGFYIAARVLLVCTVPVWSHPDTPGYLIGPSFTGAHARPWVAPLLYAFNDGRLATIVQAAVSAFAFLLLAAAVGSTLDDRRVRLATVAAILLLGLAPRVVVWDAGLISESLGLSLTALLIAALIWLDRLPVWSVVVVFTLWLFTRDAHPYLGILILAGVCVWAWPRRRWVLPACLAVVLLWAGVAAQRNNTIEAYNVTVNMASHGSDDIDMWHWFVDRGMPPSAGFIYSPFEDRQAHLLADPEFMEWANHDGTNLYTKYLATHPGFLLSAVPYIFTSNDYDGQSLVDHTNQPGTPDAPGLPFWPGEASTFTLLLMLGGLAGAAMMVARHRVRWLPLLLLASTIPHALLAYHASPWEIGRHGLELAFVLIVSSIWLIAAAVDARLGSGAGPVVVAGDRAGTDDLSEEPWRAGRMR